MKQIQNYLTTTGKMLVFSVALSSISMAMDVATYYDVDIKSMQISIDGSKKVLSLLERDAPLQEQYAVDDELQQKLQALFASVHSTPSKHAGFYMQHQKEVQDFYDNDTTLQEQYATLKQKLEAVNKQIKTLREEKK
jgi:archaellum component FlaC